MDDRNILFSQELRAILHLQLLVNLQACELVKPIVRGTGFNSQRWT